MPKVPPLFSERPVSQWIVLFQTAHAAEDRLRALQAINALCPADEAQRWAAVALNDNDISVRALAARLFGNRTSPLDTETETRLQSLLDDGDPDVRFEAARALIRCRSMRLDQAILRLLQFLDDPETDPLMLAAVVNTLVAADLSTGCVESDLLPRLLRLLDHDRAEVREAVASAFAKWPVMSKTCYPQLLVMLDDSEPLVREKIALALGLSGLSIDTVRNALQAATKDEDSEVARVATEALQRLSS